jgi:hypothetical protein
MCQECGEDAVKMKMKKGMNRTAGHVGFTHSLDERLEEQANTVGLVLPSTI